jgi:hypothetical protein
VISAVLASWGWAGRGTSAIEVVSSLSWAALSVPGDGAEADCRVGDTGAQLVRAKLLIRSCESKTSLNPVILMLDTDCLLCLPTAVDCLDAPCRTKIQRLIETLVFGFCPVLKS